MAVTITSVHRPDKFVDEVLSVTVVTTFNEVICFVPHSSQRTTQLERPQEIICFLEVVPHREDLVDEIFHADDIARSERSLNHLVVGDGYTLVVDLREPTFVYQFSDGFEVRVSPRDERFHQS